MRHSEIVEAEISSAESFCSTSQFLAHDSSPDTFLIAKAFTQRKTRPLLHKLASSLRRSVSFLQFACGAWPSTCRGVVRASCIHSAKISSEESGGIFWRNFASAKISRYTVCDSDNS